jgi:hypothetical protein
LWGRRSGALAARCSCASLGVHAIIEAGILIPYGGIL